MTSKNTGVGTVRICYSTLTFSATPPPEVWVLCSWRRNVRSISCLCVSLAFRDIDVQLISICMGWALKCIGHIISHSVECWRQENYAYLHFNVALLLHFRLFYLRCFQKSNLDISSYKTLCNRFWPSTFTDTFGVTTRFMKHHFKRNIITSPKWWQAINPQWNVRSENRSWILNEKVEAKRHEPVACF